MSRDILASLEAQLAASELDSSHDNDDSDESDDDDDDDDVGGDDDDDDDSEDFSEEEGSSSSDSGSSFATDDDANFDDDDDDDEEEETSSNMGGPDDESEVTTSSQARARLQQTRMAASQNLQVEIARLNNTKEKTQSPPAQPCMAQQQKQAAIPQPQPNVRNPIVASGNTIAATKKGKKEPMRKQDSIDASHHLHQIENSFARSKAAAIPQGLLPTAETATATTIATTATNEQPYKSIADQILHDESERLTQEAREQAEMEEFKARQAIQSLKRQKRTNSKRSLLSAADKSQQSKPQKQQQQQQQSSNAATTTTTKNKETARGDIAGDDSESDSDSGSSMSDVTDSNCDLGMSSSKNGDIVASDASSSPSSPSSSSDSRKKSETIQTKVEPSSYQGGGGGELPDLKAMPKTNRRGSVLLSTSTKKGNVQALIAGMNVNSAVDKVVAVNATAATAADIAEVNANPVDKNEGQQHQPPEQPPSEQLQKEPREREPIGIQKKTKIVIEPFSPTDDTDPNDNNNNKKKFGGGSIRSMASTVHTQRSSGMGASLASNISLFSSPVLSSNRSKPYHHGLTPFGPAVLPKVSAKAKEKYQDKKIHRSEFQLGLLLLLTGVIISHQLYQLGARRSFTRNPEHIFQQRANEALAVASSRIEDVVESLQQLAVFFQETAYTTDQQWPRVTFSELDGMDMESYEQSLIIAPMVTPKQWKRYDAYTRKTTEERERTGRATSSLLLWDDSYGAPLEALFVPWQRQTAPAVMSSPEDNSNALGNILEDWYVDNPKYEAIWESLINYSAPRHHDDIVEGMNPVLFLQSPLSASNKNNITETRRDYLLQPVVDSGSDKKGIFYSKGDNKEVKVVAVVAAQIDFSILLAEALRESFGPAVSETTSSSIAVMAYLEDTCLDSVAAYHIPLSSNLKHTLTVSPPSAPAMRSIGYASVSGGVSLGSNVQRAAGESLDDATECFGAPPSILIHFQPTKELLNILLDKDWDLFLIVCTWLVLYLFLGYASYCGLTEYRLRLQVGVEKRRQEQNFESLDPDEAFWSATVVVMNIAGWDDWVRMPSKSPCEVQSFLTSLLHAMDAVAVKHEVVKIQMVGCSLVYAVAGANHARRVAGFVRECYIRMPKWMNHFAKTYGSATKELLFIAGLDSSSLTDGHLLTSQVSGNAFRTAARLESIGESGRVLMSKGTANILRRLKKANWVQSNEGIAVGEELFWLNTSKTLKDQDRLSNSRKSSGQLTDSRKSLGSGRSLLADSRKSPQSGRSIKSAITSNSSKKGRASADSPTPLARMEIVRKTQSSPPPLKNMNEFPAPPVGHIDILQNSTLDIPSTPDLGYEDAEPQQHYDEYEEYDDPDEERSDTGSFEHKQIEMAEKKERLIEWSVDVLTRCLEEVLAARTTTFSKKALAGLEDQLGKGSNILEQCKDVITIPIFSKSELQERAQPGSIKMTNAAATQLREYVSKIANHYHDEANMFHNFEHAANVTASMRKLFNKLGNDFSRSGSNKSLGGLKNIMKDNSGRSLFSSISVGDTSSSFGITTDPLIKFSIIFCALIHDVDHPGVSNSTLVLQNSPMATVYKKRSICEQNSVDFSWTLLMRPEYVDLRSAIYCDEKELRRFRQVIVNCVLATDLHDNEQQMTRKARWSKAFSDDQKAVGIIKPRRKKPLRKNTKSTGAIFDGKIAPARTSSGGGMLAALRDAAHDASKTFMTRPKDIQNRKGTIVLEHLLQAADITHCMQNWKVYLKWNERLFDENYEAFAAGRIKEDPADSWYQGELDFFDFTVIPLAKKLVSCGVLGEAAEELMENTFLNRDEWEVQGHDIMAIYLEHYKEAHVHQIKAEQPIIENIDVGGDETTRLSVLALDDSRDNSQHSEALSLHNSRESLPPVPEDFGSTNGNNDKLPTVDQKCEQTAITEDTTTKGDTAVPHLIPGTANSSVDGTNSYDGTASETGDPDIVFAVLEDPNAPDDFDSYVLVTPKQKRKREEAEMAAKNPNMNRRRARRSRSNSTQLAVKRFGVRRSSTDGGGNSFHTRRSSTDGGNSFHTRRSVASFASARTADSFEGSKVDDSKGPL